MSRCTTDVDAGDSAIHSTLSPISARPVRLNQVSSGGLRIHNNKFNGGAYGYYMDLATGANILDPDDLGQQFRESDEQRHSHAQQWWWGTFTHAMVMDNMFANQPKAINLDSSGAWLSLVTIEGNSIMGPLPAVRRSSR